MRRDKGQNKDTKIGRVFTKKTLPPSAYNRELKLSAVIVVVSLYHSCLMHRSCSTYRCCCCRTAFSSLSCSSLFCDPCCSSYYRLLCSTCSTDQSCFFGHCLWSPTDRTFLFDLRCRIDPTDPIDLIVLTDQIVIGLCSAPK